MLTNSWNKRSKAYKEQWLASPSHCAVSRPVRFPQLRNGDVMLKYSRQFEAASGQNRAVTAARSARLESYSCHCSKLKCLTSTRQGTKSHHIWPLSMLQAAVLFCEPFSALPYCCPMVMLTSCTQDTFTCCPRTKQVTKQLRPLFKGRSSAQPAKISQQNLVQEE